MDLHKIFLKFTCYQGTHLKIAYSTAQNKICGASVKTKTRTMLQFRCLGILWKRKDFCSSLPVRQSTVFIQ